MAIVEPAQTKQPTKGAFLMRPVAMNNALHCFSLNAIRQSSALFILLDASKHRLSIAASSVGLATDKCKFVS